jgi:hypothetical protein
MNLRWTVFLAAAVLAASSLAAPAPEGEYVAPVGLHTPILETPIETAGTGIAPTVTVEVKVDPRGVVSEVQVRKIDPPSEFDDLFRQITRDTIESWRYAPALQNGVPVEATMKWSVQFPARSEGPEQDSRQGFNWSFRSRKANDTESARRRILSLPLQQRLAMLQNEAQRAVSFMDQAKRKRVESNRFIVFSDAPTTDVPQVMGNNLDALFYTLEDMFSGAIDPQPERYKIVVVVFERRLTFENYKSATRRMEWASGFYYPAGMIAMYREMPTSEILLSTLLHEGTHAFLDRHVVRPGRGFPRWIDEGFAEYIGNSRVKKKQLVPGKTQRSQIYRTPFGLMMGESHQTLSVEEVRAAVRKKTALTVSDLVEADRETFYGEKRDLYYPMSWLLVHFLNHGMDDRGSERFADFLLYVAEGYPAGEVFRSVYGMEPGSLNDRFHDYVRKF